MRRGAALLLALVFGAGCGDEEAAEPSGPDFDALEADQVMVQVEHYLTDDGVRRAHLLADTVYFVDDGSTARLRRFTIDFFGSEGARTSVLTALEGLYQLESGDMRAEREVVVEDAQESQRLTTERIVYDVSEDRLQSDVDFMLVRGRDTITGTGFVTDPGLDSLVTRRPSVVSPGGPAPPGAGGSGARADTASTPSDPANTPSDTAGGDAGDATGA